MVAKNLFKLLVLAVAAISIVSARRLNEEAEQPPVENTSDNTPVDSQPFDGSVVPALIEPRAAAMFINPTHNGRRLDWCKNWSKNCGKPAADLFCQQRGYVESQAYVKLSKHGGPTNVIGHYGMVCWAPFCDTFSSISCKRFSKTFHKPKVGGYRLDWCKYWSSQCGKPAADKYCKNKGYQSATSYKIDENIGVPTKVISGNGQVCHANYCDGFDYIVCEK